MRARTRLEKLEQWAGRHYSVLRLPDGTEIKYTGDDALDAMFAAIDEADHWLHPYIRQIDTKGGFPGLIRSLMRSTEQVKRGEEQ